MIEIPHWIQVFVLVGIALVVIVVPIKILYEMTKDSRERVRRFRDLGDRLKERFGEVEAYRTMFGTSRIRFKHEGRPATIFQPMDDEILIELDTSVRPKFPVLIRTRGSLTPRFKMMWDPLKMLSLIPTHDPLIDDSIVIYSTPLFGNFLREAALDGIPAGGKPTGLAESLVILRKMPGVRRFEVLFSPSSGVQLRFKLRAEDMLHRPEELESAVHHAFQLYDLLVLY